MTKPIAYDDWEQRYRQAVSLLAVSSVHVSRPEIQSRVNQFLLDQIAIDEGHFRLDEVREALMGATRRELLDRFGGHGVRRRDLGQLSKEPMVDYLVERFGAEFPPEPA